MQAILTKTLPTTINKPTRIKAYCEAGSLTMTAANIASDKLQGDIGTHSIVAKALAKKLGWEGHLHGGYIKNGYAFVFSGDNWVAV